MSSEETGGAPGFTPPRYNEVVDHYGLELLREGGDLSLADGDLALTKDLDLKLGDTVHNALFRLVQVWRLNAPHLEFLFHLSAAMASRQADLEQEDNEQYAAHCATYDRANRSDWSRRFSDQREASSDRRGAASYGEATYAGSLVMLLSGMLLRFKDDIEVSEDDWRGAGPLMNGISVGQLLVAAANGMRHQDEWNKTRPAKPQQRRSQDVLALALPPRGPRLNRAPGRCPEVLAALSGGCFDKLSTRTFEFAHQVAKRCGGTP